MSRDLLFGCVGLEKRPTPTIAPQGVIREATLFISDQDKPNLGIGRPVGVSSGQLRVVCSMDLLHQPSAISELLVATVVLGGSGRRPGEVHLIALRIEPRVCP